jgi:hypothetical protein
VRVIDDETGCGGGIDVQAPYVATVVQVGAALTITTPSGVFTGTASGDTAVVSGTYPDGAGYTTYTAWVLTSEPAGFSGDVAWTYSLDADGAPIECSGTSVVSGVRVPHDFSGSWLVQVTGGVTDCGDGDNLQDGDFCATAEQSLDELTITTPFGVFTGLARGDEAVVSGTYPDGAGYTTFTSWVLTARPDGFEGSVAWTYSLSADGLPVECQGSSLASGAPPPPVTLAFAPLQAIETGDAVSHSMALGGGIGGPYAASLGSGQLPPGVSLQVSSVSSPTGNIPVLLVEGVALQSGFFDFSIGVSDLACSEAGAGFTQFQWEILQGPVRIPDYVPIIPVASYAHPLKYTDVDGLPDVIYNVFAVHNLTLVGGSPPYACEVVDDLADPDDDGLLPLGLSIPVGSTTISARPWRKHRPGARAA